MRKGSTTARKENRELKKLRRHLQRKHHVKIERCVKLSVCDYSDLGHMIVQIGEVHFRLLGTNSYYVKAKNKRFNVASSRCRHNLKYENFTSFFGRLRKKFALKSVPHVQHDYFYSLKQSNN